MSDREDPPAGTPSRETPPQGLGGLVSVFARHRTAANLLMVFMIVTGLFALDRLNTQFFPDFGIDVISVSVEWSGASAEDVDSNIVQAIEPEIRFLDGVKQVISNSAEGMATISVEYFPGSDMQAALSDVETAVGQVTTLPEEAERPEIRRIVRYDTISRVLLSGPYSEPALKAFAERMRDQLLDRGIDKIDLVGTRDEEIWVELDQEKLLELDTTLDEVAQRIRQTSQDLPSGDTAGGSVRQIRSLGLEKTAEGIGGIVLRSQPNGEQLLVSEAAEVSEAFDENQATVWRRGGQAVELHIQRAVTGDALEVADTVDAYLAEIRPTLPANLNVEQYDVQAELIRSRISLLLENGFTGLILVLIVLFIFLNAHVAFWVAMGIPVAILATMVVMLFTGQSINMVSLFGMIMALGIIVDDAIVVGEHAEARFRAGLPPIAAAEAGARRMAAPVVSSSLTTIAAFLPLLVISDIIGTIISAIPYVVIAIIVASLIECFFVLPGHMRSAFGAAHGRESGFRRWFNRNFDAFRDGPFRRAVTTAVAWRSVTIACALAVLILCIGLIAGGRVSFQFFPSPEPDTVYANVQMVSGTPREDTRRMLMAFEDSLERTERKLTDGKGGLVEMHVARLGTQVGIHDTPFSSSGDSLGGVIVELAPSDSRAVRTSAFIEAWREELETVAGVDSVTIVAAQGGPPGREIDVRLMGGDLDVLKQAAHEVRELLTRYPGISDIEDDLPYGKLETIIEVTPEGRALGFDTQSVGQQVRHAYDGAIAKRFPRGDEEVTVRVRFARDAADAGLIDRLYLRSPEGMEVPLSQIVDQRESQGFSRIRREDGQRQVAVTAEVEEAVTNNNKVLEALQRDGLYEIAKKYDLKVDFAGKAEEQATTLGDMQTGAMLALVAIYIVLAWVFGSYTRPIVVMGIIPLSFVGAVIGHFLLGYDLTILSLIALVGLSGIVVNDSIILVTTIDERVREGQAVHDAVIDGTCDRLRAVMLTSMTTMGGLTPLIFETSFQAQFLIPMAITIVFGLMITTLLVLLVTPALIAIQGDVGTLLRGRRAGRDGIPAQAE